MTSLKNVAKLAGVSLMTVSRAINEPHKLNEKTLKVVRAAIKELNYVPNLSAQRIRGSDNTPSIGVFSLEAATTPFSVEILLSIEKTVKSYGWSAFFVNTFKGEDQSKVVDLLLSHRPAGIIFATMGLKDIQIPEKLKALPIVLANCITHDASVPGYIPNNYQGQYDATAILIEKGYQKPLCVYLPKTSLATQARRKGFRQAWADHKMPFEPVEYYINGGAQENFLEMIPILQKHLVNQKDDFDVVICGNDRLAFVAYQFLLGQGFNIPQDIAILGFDAMVGVYDLFTPSLATISLPHYEMGKQATLHLIEKRTDKDTHYLDCPLLPGESI
ncbi:MAG TPA: transcriptional regulator [Pasteurellaceae bacterium]|nr:transcriptional regulator [Pasteurellaceae bacterium]